MINAVNRGMLTVLCVAINMILVSPIPELSFLIRDLILCVVSSEAKHLLLLPGAPDKR